MAKVLTDLAQGLQECVGDLWGGDDYSDFSVVVEGTIYRCHRFILAACSGFFQCLFRSNMKECQTQIVNIGGMSKDTFDVVVKSIYKGIDGLTSDNFFNVWSAAEQLQIQYLSKVCERRAMDELSLENCFKVLSYADKYLSDIVKSQALEYITENFENFRLSNDLFQLSFENFSRITACDKLKTVSEDLVFETVFSWLECKPDFMLLFDLDEINNSLDTRNKLQASPNMESAENIEVTDSLCSKNIMKETDADDMATVAGENEVMITDNTIQRKEDVLDFAEFDMKQFTYNNTLEDKERTCLVVRAKPMTFRDNLFEDRTMYVLQLLKTCRLFLVSPKIIEKVMKTKKSLLKCPETQDLLLDALMYQQCVERRHQCWPDLAVHRLYDNMRHVMVYIDSDENLMAFCLNTDSTFFVKKLPQCCECVRQITVFDNKLFLFYKCKTGNCNKMCILSNEMIWITEEALLPVDKDSENFNKDNNSYCELLSHGNYIYSKTNDTLLKYECLPGGSRKWSKYKTIKRNHIIKIKPNSLEYLKFGYFSFGFVSYHGSILIFKPDKDSIIVDCIQTETNIVKESITRMDGSYIGMKSFIHQGNTFLLQTNGTLWKIVGSEETVDVILVSKLWNSDRPSKLCGCVVLKKKLFVFYKEIKMTECNLSSIPDVCDEIRYVKLNTEFIACPMIVPISWLSDPSGAT